jgi:hypothetical protein
MTPLGRRQKCLRIWSEKRQFRVSYVSAMQNWPVVARWKGLRAQNPASNVAFAQPPVSVRL